jgi:hypothetical protein
MPSGTLPNAGSLGDPQITTGDYQTQINQILAYVRSLQAEVATLSGTTIKEGAVRGVGTAASELVETSQLDTRLGTSGNLGSAALLDTGTADTELATVGDNDIRYMPRGWQAVFAGTASSVTQSAMGSPGAGLYAVRFFGQGSTDYTSLMYYDGANNASFSSGLIDRTSAYWIDSVYMSPSGTITAEGWAISKSSGEVIGETGLSILEVRFLG